MFHCLALLRLAFWADEGDGISLVLKVSANLKKLNNTVLMQAI
jgi:hypothetical protein